MCTNRVSYPTPSNSIADNPPPPPPTKLQLMHDWPFAFKCNRVIACTKKMFISFFFFSFFSHRIGTKIIDSFQYTNLSVFFLQQMPRWMKTNWFPVSQSGCHRSYSLSHKCSLSSNFEDKNLCGPPWWSQSKHPCCMAECFGLILLLWLEIAFPVMLELRTGIQVYIQMIIFENY